MATTERLDFDLLDPNFYVDHGTMHAAFDWMRSNEPVYRDDRNGTWAITTWNDVVEVERRDRTFVSGRGYRSLWFDAESNMISNDDPRHAERRGLLARQFTPKAVHQWEPEVRRIIGELVESATERGEIDLVEDLASQLPARLTCVLLGFPEDRWRDVKRWSERLMRIDQVMKDPEVGMEFGQSILEFAELMVPLVEERKGCPMHDLLSVWGNAEVQGEPYALNNLIDETGLFISGGAETTRTVIARSLLTFTQHPDQWELLAREPQGIERAVEEMLRWVTPLNNFFRTASEPTEIHGVPMAEGDRLVLLYPSANRDEAVFGPTAGAFDVTRDPNPHVAFGRGTHHCLGAALARMELRILFEELTSRWTALRTTAEPQLEANIFVTAIVRAPFAFDRR